jgi:hypothetical protein
MVSNDKFYTKKEIAQKCIEFTKKYYKLNDEIVLEPSAGNGSFLDFLKNFEAYDLLPEDDRIIQKDFFTFESNKKDYIAIGNPPFGKRSKMAIDFFNKVARYSKAICFIVPVSFMKWSVQKQLDDNFKLIDYFYLPLNSFLDREKEFSIRTIFQIWTKKEENSLPDIRLKNSPPISHKDFNIWQYNATPEALKVIDNNWKIATYRQGYHDYNQKFYPKDKDYIYNCMRGIGVKGKQQFFFIEPLSFESEIIINSMDFNALAERNTTTPGFGKGDFVSYYLELKKNLDREKEI